MIKIVGKRILVEREKEVEKTTSSGLFIPQTAQEKPKQGYVVSKGDVDFVNVGDCVVFPKFAGIEINVEGKEYLIIKDYDIIATLNNNVLRVMGERVLIEMEPVADKMKVGGVDLVIPDEYQYMRLAATYGVVKQVGIIKWEELTFSVDAGEKVAVQLHCGLEIKIDGVEHRIIKPHDILGVCYGTGEKFEPRLLQ